MAPQSRGGHSRKLSNYSLSSPNLRSLSSLNPSFPSIERNGDFTATSPDADVEDDSDDNTDDADFQSHYSLDNQSSSSGASSDNDSSNEQENQPLNQPRRSPSRRPQLQHAHSQPANQTTTLLHPTPFFGPPFYNRPPTPLPPSPSLTSLLRPPFSTSATPSRPTTPDSSDPETPNDTEAAVAKSARIATTVPRASPKVPTYEYYGFVLYLVSSLAFLIYLLWSYLPSPFLHALGIHYYPDRWWSLAVPAFLVMLIVYIYVALAAYNTGYLTLPMDSVECVVDEHANVAVVGGKWKKGKMRRGEMVDWRTYWGVGTDAVLDVPVGGVCEVLYGEGRDMEEESDGEEG